jgi:hypothetical protein
MESHTLIPKIDGSLLTSEEARKTHEYAIFIEADLELCFMKAREQLDALRQLGRTGKSHEGIEG